MSAPSETDSSSSHISSVNMSQKYNIEPFPAMTAVHKVVEESSIQKTGGSTRPRRKSSGLGGDPRGDTEVPALASIVNQNPPMTASLSSRSRPTEPVRGRRRRKARSLLRRWKAISLRHTWLNPLILILVVLSLYIRNPSSSNSLHKALFLSYPLPKQSGSDTILFGKGRDDFAFVAFYTIVFTFTREFIMQRIIRPIAVRAGIRSRSRQSRFMEQYYTAIYFGIFGPFGMYVMSRTPVWYFSTKGMFEGFPHTTHEGIVKAYYLLQASYWTQQAIVMILMLEKPRKDFKELLLHHVVTVSLIGLSYAFHFTYMGVAVYITHDISDFFLATSKVLNYLDSPIVTPYFGIFIAVWTYLRHYINLKILFAMLPLPNPILYAIHDRYPSIYQTISSSAFPLASYFFPSNPIPSHSPNITESALFPGWKAEFATVGPYNLDWDGQQYKCWISQLVTFTLLAILQAVNLFWLFLILRIAFRLVASKGEVKKDERSDDEDSDVDAEENESSAKEQADAAPALLVNGKPLDVTQAAANGDSNVRERRKR